MQTLSFSRPFQEFLLQSRANQLQQVPEFMRLSFSSLEQKASPGFQENKKFGHLNPITPGLLATDIHRQFTEHPLPRLPF